MKRMRSISLLFAITILLGLLFVFADEAKAATLAELQAKYPNGHYWNHYVSNVNEAGDLLDDRGDESFGGNVTNTPCASHASTDPYFYVGKYDCNYFDGAWQCMGFARRLGYEAFGSKVSSWGVHQSVSAIKPGDVVRFWSPVTDQTHGHTVFVTAVSGTVITVAEANFVGDPCRIRWGGQYDLSTAWSVSVNSAPRALDTTPGTPAQITINWDLYVDKLWFAETNANIAFWSSISGTDTSAISNVSVYLYDYKGTQLAKYSENVSLGSWSYFYGDYNIEQLMGYTLSAGTEYKYKFSATIYGTEYYSPEFSFVTHGYHSHAYDDGVVTASTTCTASGNRRFTCKTCGHIWNQTFEPWGHLWKNATCSAPKTCDRCGTTSGTALGHTYTNDADTSCNRCGGFAYPGGNTLYKEGDTWFHIVNRAKVKDTTLVSYGGTWYYVRNGIVDFTANTLVKYGSTWYHVKGGKWVKDTAMVGLGGTTYYVKNGTVDFSANGFTYCNGNWYNLSKGAVQKTTTLINYGGKWWYVKDGVWTKATTLVNYGGTWYYVRNGIVDFTANTLVKYGSTWYHVKGGKWVKDTTMIYLGSTQYYVKNGTVDFTANGLTYCGGKWYNLSKGAVLKTSTLVNYGGKWWYVKDGVWTKTTTLVKYGTTWYYVKDGIVDFTFSGTVPYGGKYYTVKNGKMVS